MVGLYDCRELVAVNVIYQEPDQDRDPAHP